MEYNSELDRLILPEYGRNIHNMVNYCLTIPDKATRQQCANAIITAMGNLFPNLRDFNDYKHLLWDHLAIISDFKLDIDYPYEVIRKEDLYSRPPRIPYSSSRFRYRHYGAIVERMLKLAIDEKDEEKRKRLVFLLANQMKRSYVLWNKDTVENPRIFADLNELSHGKFRLSEQDIRLISNEEVIAQANENTRSTTQQSGKKKKKNHSNKNK